METFTWHKKIMYLKNILILLIVTVINSYGAGDWSSVSSSECKSAGGELEAGECKGSWEVAEKICSNKGYRLPYLFELMIAKQDGADRRLFKKSIYWSSNNNSYYSKKKRRIVKGDSYWVQNFSYQYTGVYPVMNYYSDKAFIKCTNKDYWKDTAFQAH